MQWKLGFRNLSYTFFEEFRQALKPGFLREEKTIKEYVELARVNCILMYPPINSRLIGPSEQ